MKRIVLVTRGRTGSTAIIDELGKVSHLIASQELFLLDPITNKDLLKDYYKLLPPFDHWKRQAWWWKRWFPNYYSDVRQADRYLTNAESRARRQGAKGFVWKMLSHQFDERPYLGDLLQRHNYRVIYLRRNSVHQVLSGMVANQRGIYNSLEIIEDTSRYRIDIEQFKWLVQWERESVRKDCARLTAVGLDFIQVSYEDFCTDRQNFYKEIFSFLDLPLALPPPSDFVKMIGDLKSVIENYDELLEEMVALGETT